MTTPRELSAERLAEIHERHETAESWFRHQPPGLAPDFRKSVTMISDLLAHIAHLDAKIAATVEALETLVAAVTTEVNEKGAGGYLLARLSEARKMLA